VSVNSSLAKVCTTETTPSREPSSSPAAAARDSFTVSAAARESSPSSSRWCRKYTRNIFDTILEFVEASPGRFDAMYTGYGRATAMSLLYPRFSAVVPSPEMGSVPVALAVPEGDEDLVQLVNAFLEEERASGLLEAKLDYWVRGKGARAEHGPRWSFGRDVLGWWKD
jgi:hypothetical protein